MAMTRSRRIASCVLTVVCLWGPVDSPAQAIDHGPKVQGPYIIASYPDGFSMHGIDGDTKVVVGVRPEGVPGRPVGINVAHRTNGHMLGEVVEPPVGWITPLSVIIEAYNEVGPGTDGSMLVLDAGGNPAEAGSVTTRIHRFTYSYTEPDGFSSQWVETHALPTPGPPVTGQLPTGILYVAGFVKLPDDTVAVTDTVAGAIWVAGPSLENWQLMMIDPDFQFGFGGVVTGTGRAQGGGTRTYQLQTPFGLYPGIHSITYAAPTDELCTLRTATPGGIWAIPRSVLLDTTIPPFLKGASKRVLVPPTPGLSDLADGIVHDRYHPTSQWVYWQRSIADAAGGGSNTLRRVSLTTGAIEVVASSNVLYDFTNNIAALPPLTTSAQYTTIASAMGQEENNPDVNVLLHGVATYVAPTLITAVNVRAE